MCCSLRSVIGFGIFLAIIDILQGLTTLVWYGYRFLWWVWYLCPSDLPVQDCHQVHYHHNQYYTLRNYIGIGEGVVTPIFAIVYIIALVRHKPWLTWLWIVKAFAILGINVYFISQWIIRQNTTMSTPTEYDPQYLWISIGLTASEVLLLLVFCMLGGIFTYKVFEERRRSRRSLNRLHKMGRGRATAPPLDVYDDEASIIRGNIDHQFLNHGLTDSTNKMPLPGSNCSLDEVGQASTLRAPTQV